MNRTKEQLGGIIADMENEKCLVEILGKLQGIDDLALKALQPIIGCLADIFNLPHEPGNDDLERMRNKAGFLNHFLGMFKNSELSQVNFQNLLYQRRDVLNAMGYLDPFLRNLPQVRGALALILHALRIRYNIDLLGAAIDWKKKLGSPVINQSVSKVANKYPFLVPVAFSSRVDLTDPKLNHQYFGEHPALRHPDWPETNNILKSCWEKWPLQDIYALCPIQQLNSNRDCEQLYFEYLNWEEQKDALKPLKRRYPELTIRFANLPELMFLDYSLRLENGSSPFDVWSFKCEHPSDPNQCLSYGSVKEYGGVIQIDKDPKSEYGGYVLPLFILDSKPTK